MGWYSRATEENLAMFVLYNFTLYPENSLNFLAREATKFFGKTVTARKLAHVISIYQLPIVKHRKGYIRKERIISTEVRKMSEVISLEEFENLLEAENIGKGKVATSEIIEWLSDKAATTAEIANHFNLKPVSMLARLKRLRKNGMVQVKTDGKKFYWTSAGSQ